MKKLLMSLALLGIFAAMTAKGDSYLYWMVDDATYANGDNNFSFYSAQLFAVKEGEDKQFVGASLGSGNSTTKNVSFDVSGFSDGWSFMVELYADSAATDPFTQSSSTIAYSTALQNGAIYEHLAPSGAGVATFHTFNVPEPTSGLLMLFGLCGLALRRKRA